MIPTPMTGFAADPRPLWKPLAMAPFLSLPRLLTRERMLVRAGAAFCLFAATAFHVSPAAGLLFVSVGANLRRETRPRAE